jgi:hypothetical protein
VTQETNEVMFFEEEPDTSSSDDVPDLHQEHSHTWGSLVPPNRRLMQDFCYIHAQIHTCTHTHNLQELIEMDKDEAAQNTSHTYTHTNMHITCRSSVKWTRTRLH